jgi:hypothetical protein
MEILRYISVNTLHKEMIMMMMMMMVIIIIITTTIRGRRR